MDGYQQGRRSVGGPARGFVVVADPELAVVRTEVGGAAVTSYHDRQDAFGGEQVLVWSARSLVAYSRPFGPYPYAELGLVAVPGDLRSAFKATGDRDLGAFWRRRFATAGGRVEVVMGPAPAALPEQRRSPEPARARQEGARAPL